MLLIYLTCILLIISLIVLIVKCFKKNENFYNYKDNCIAVLTKGYKNNNDYKKLIDRNQHIYKNCYKILNYPDILIFHEGNITLSQPLANTTHPCRILHAVYFCS